MKVDYIIVGQGLAGSLIAYELLKRNKKIIVYDLPEDNHSSSVAAGLFNPVTGRRFVKTWKADTLFPYLHDFYPKAEKNLESKFFYRLPLYRPFIDLQEQNKIMPDVNDFNGTEDTYMIPANFKSKALRINEKLGGAHVRSAGFLDIPVFIDSVRKRIQENGKYFNQQFVEENLTLNGEAIQYGEFTTQKIIFCNGVGASISKLFGWLPFRPVKGELIFATISPPFEFIYNRNLFVLPFRNEIHKVGSTYDWERIDSIPTEEGKKMLENKLNAILDVNFKTINHIAGVRPATKDRRPFIGRHPQNKNIGIFNGLGSKGVSLGPYFAGKFIDSLESNTEIEFEANIKRYNSLY
jgi:glycine/D-amino acid oxidase-like deaminating enzyme